MIFVDRDRVFAIEGRNAYAIEEFGAGAIVSHAFLMRGDGLHGVRVRLNADRPATASVRWVLWNGSPEVPSQMLRAFEGVESMQVAPNREWQSIRFVRNGSSDDRWFTIELQLLSPAANAADPGHPRVSLVASRDNPYRGGVLWVADERQPGSLFLQAESTGRTLYQRFLAEGVTHFPGVLQLPLVHWTAFGLLHWAFLVFARSVITDGDGRNR